MPSIGDNMNPELLSSYAELILKVGVSLKEGQNLKIAGEPVHWDFVNLLVERAYRLGARYVEPELVHPKVSIHRANCSREAYLDYIPETLSSEVRAMVDEEWSFLRLEGKAEPDVFREMNQERNVVVARALSENGKPLKNAVLAREKSWCVAPLPTPKWAAEVLGREASDQTLKDFWDVLIPILRLDRDDPARHWTAHGEQLRRRCEWLDGLCLDYLRFVSPDTDLTVYLNPGARFLGGPLTTIDGRDHFPNLPTEEVFTTPDYRRTEGRAKATKPVTVLGSPVHGAWFEFKNGEVSRFGADEGEHLLDKYFEIDSKNRFLGEVALVDETSPIARSGRVFNAILIDENASSHIALGSGYPAALSNAEGLSEDELDERGCNKALLHVDFMIGSASTTVIGGTSGGEEMVVMENGVFVG
jgi:aminopeptidase